MDSMFEFESSTTQWHENRVGYIVSDGDDTVIHWVRDDAGVLQCLCNAASLLKQTLEGVEDEFDAMPHGIETMRSLKDVGSLLLDAMYARVRSCDDIKTIRMPSNWYIDE